MQENAEKRYIIISMASSIIGDKNPGFMVDRSVLLGPSSEVLYLAQGREIGSDDIFDMAKHGMPSLYEGVESFEARRASPWDEYEHIAPNKAVFPCGPIEYRQNPRPIDMDSPAVACAGVMIEVRSLQVNESMVN